jgi:hypothetical protein
LKKKGTDLLDGQEELGERFGEVQYDNQIQASKVTLICPEGQIR